MKNKIVFLLLLIIISLPTFAYTKQQLGDSLTVFANQYAWVGKVGVKKVKVSGNNAWVYATKSLAGIPWNRERVTACRMLVSKLLFGNTQGKITIYGEEDEIGTLVANLSNPFRLNIKDEPLVQNATLPYETRKGLKNRHLAVYGSHGMFYNQKQQRWQFQRAKLHTTVEDVFSSAFVQPFLVPMLENAGAIVLQPRERDLQRLEVLTDDSDLQLPEGWEQADTLGWGYQPVLYERQNPFCLGGYAYATIKPHLRQLRYTPKVPATDNYAVYISYKTLPKSTDKAEYTVVHSGMTTRFFVNQQMGGGTWIYLGTFRFEQGEPSRNYIAVGADADRGQVLTSDCVRLGGGMGSVARYPFQKDSTFIDSANALISGMPRYMEGSRYFLQYAGIPDSVYNFKNSKDDYTDDFTSRGRWLNYLIGGSKAYPEGVGLKVPADLMLAFHTDEALRHNDSIIGTLTIYTSQDDDKQPNYPQGASRMQSRRLADKVQTQVVEDLQRLVTKEWPRREMRNASYSETRNPKIPAIILELLSHQNFQDMKFAQDPRFRFIASRAVYKGILKFLHEQYGTDYVVQPLPVHRFAIGLEDENFRLSWQPRIDTLEQTATADYYVVYTRLNGAEWDSGVRVSDTTWVFTNPQKGEQYDFKVVAGNDGGISFPSEVLSACISTKHNKKGKTTVLIVNAFTRVASAESFATDSTFAGFFPESYSVPYQKEWHYIGAQNDFYRLSPYINDDDAGYGNSFMDYAGMQVVGNTFDYPSLHGKVLKEMGLSFVSCSVEAWENGYLSGVENDKLAFVDLIEGKQLNMSAKTQTHVKQTLEQSVPMLMSGAYFLGAMTTKAEKRFLANVLQLKNTSKRATHTGELRLDTRLGISNQEDAQIYIKPNEQTICAEAVGGIFPANENAVLLARYADTGLGAGVSMQNTGSRALIFAFPLEALHDFDSIYKQSINLLLK